MFRPEASAHTEEEIVAIPASGNRIIANFTVSETNKLTDAETFRKFVDLLVDEFKLSKIGEVFHQFENGGFTGVICLAESHLSIRTWPDRNCLTFDVFLSNYLRDNSPTTEALYRSIRTFFDAVVVFEQRLVH